MLHWFCRVPLAFLLVAYVEVGGRLRGSCFDPVISRSNLQASEATEGPHNRLGIGG